MVDEWFPKNLVASTTKFCSKKKRDFEFASCSAKFTRELALPWTSKKHLTQAWFLRCYIFFRKQYEIEQHIQDCLKSTVVHKDEMGQEAQMQSRVFLWPKMLRVFHINKGAVLTTILDRKGRQRWSKTSKIMFFSFDFEQHVRDPRKHSRNQYHRVVRQSTWRHGIAILQPSRCWCFGPRFKKPGRMKPKNW